MNTEFYVQDNWRVKPKFTIDAGVRFYYLTPTQSEGDDVAVFGPNSWSAAAAPQLYQPVSTPQGRRAVNPVTGEILPLVYIGRLVPGTGDFINGMEVFEGTPQQDHPFRVAPRLGFAWDVTGDGKTAVRGGAGVFYDRYSDDNVLDLIELPPLLNTYTTNYTTMPELLASPLTATPTAVRLIDEFKPPVVYNWSLGIQREIGWNFVGDVGLRRQRRPRPAGRPADQRPAIWLHLSAVQPGSDQRERRASSSRCPTTCCVRIADTAASRSAPSMATGDYHSLQFTVNRRRSYRRPVVRRVLHLRAGQQDAGRRSTRSSTNNRRPELPLGHRQRRRRKHNLVLNYSYEMPNIGQRWNNLGAQAAVRRLAGLRYHHDPERHAPGLHLRLYGRADRHADRYRAPSTAAAAASSSPATRTCRAASGPSSASSAPSASRRRPTSSGSATAMNDEYIGPGLLNFDFSVFKNIAVGGTRRLQFRLEMYNAFNSDQWTATASTPRRRSTTRPARSPTHNFGRLTGATFSARRIQLGARFTF